MLSLSIIVDWNTTNFLNSTILFLNIQMTNGIDVDSKFLNRYVFARLKSIDLFGHMNSIEPEVFKPLKELRYISIQYFDILFVIRRQGIDWIKNINSDVNVKLNNQTDVDLNQDKFFSLKLYSNREFWASKSNHYFDEEDFCLFVDYPFHQLVFFLPHQTEDSLKYRNNTPYTCTELWLYQFYREAQYIYNETGK